VNTEDLRWHMIERHQVATAMLMSPDELKLNHAVDHMSVISIRVGLADHVHSTIRMCDGCALIGTDVEQDAHIRSTFDPRWATNPHLVKEIQCWGSYAIGSEAFVQHRVYGRHPMEKVREMVAEAFTRIVSPNN
jgi:hypothetical protein